ncbi:MAG: hypothetical protein GXP51_07235 [Deltaproteobacteria bacterium]|nr:hypothetical protein [Deltaproteobacteria bacterium]
MSRDRKKTARPLKTARNAFSAALFRANQYKQVVQKKIDLGAIHKKIEQLYVELGKAVGDQYQSGQKDFLANKEISRLLEKLLSLKQVVVLLEEEIELIRNEPQATAEKSGPTEKPPNAD